MLSFAGFVIDGRRAELRGPDGEVIKLRPKAFDMLVFFAGHRGRLITKQELMERFWPGLHVGEDSLFQCIREIRSALGDQQRQIIRNISGRGYLFEAEVVDEPDTPHADDLVVVHEVAPAAPVVDTCIVLPMPDVTDAPAPAMPGRRRTVIALMACAGLLLIGAGAVLIPMLSPPITVQNLRPAVAVMPVVAADGEAQARAMVAGVTDRLSSGLARIENIRVVAPTQVTARASLEPAATRSATADYVVTTELLQDEENWRLRARMVRSASGEIAWSADLPVSGDADRDTLQSRLAAAVGHPLALRLNAILNDAVVGGKDKSGKAKVAVEQATASIVHTSPERFRAAEEILRAALKDDPDNIDLQAALAALQLRGIQMVWYRPDERDAVRANARQLMERVLQVKPTYVPVLESYCRLLSATNHFVESLVACARTLSFDPWNGLALYHIGLNQIFLGRFEEAVTNFKLADQYDTPTVSRWTWLLGAGLALVHLQRYEEAVPWLERSLAVTQGTGRTHLVLMIAYHCLGREADAKAMLARALALRPGATAENVGPPLENVSPVYLEAAERARVLMVEAGLPER